MPNFRLQQFLRNWRIINPIEIQYLLIYERFYLLKCVPRFKTFCNCVTLTEDLKNTTLRDRLLLHTKDSN